MKVEGGVTTLKCPHTSCQTRDFCGFVKIMSIMISRWFWNCSLYLIIVLRFKGCNRQLSTSIWGVNGETLTQCIMDVKRTQRLKDWRLTRGKTRIITRTLLPFKISEGDDASSLDSSVVAKPSEWHLRGSTTNVPSAHSSARKAELDFVDSSRVLLYFSTGFEHYVPQNT